MSTTIKNGKLVIELPLQTPTLSKSGKTHIVASTGGFASTTAEINGKIVKISVNAII